MIKIESVTFSYGRRKEPVLDDFSLDVDKGGVYGLLGPNGVGKSTLLYIMSGLLKPGSGACFMDGVNVNRRLPSTMSGIFLVPEEFEFPAMPLSEYVKVHSVFYPNFSEEEMMENLRLFELEGDINLGALSMGQRKKALTAFALACNTPVVLMDEPTNGLDIPGKATFRRLIARYAGLDRIIIISTHQVRDVDSLLDHILIMNRRRVLLNATVDEIQSRLKFETTTSIAAIEHALHSVPSIGGTNIVTLNDDDSDTRLNLEVLFDFAFADPEVLSSIFKNSKTISDE